MENSGDEPGFWMRDEMLELWLRLLSLHLPELPTVVKNSATADIRNKWLLASRGYFNGCVPHEMEFACSTPERTHVVRAGHPIVDCKTRRIGCPLLNAGTLKPAGQRRIPVFGHCPRSIARNRLRVYGLA